MPVTAELLRNITAEARPIIERQMKDAEIIAGLRKVVSANGGDWSALKALIKAHVEDEADDDGEGKRVQKILDKADSSTAYADMLGLANMNKENFSSSQSYAGQKGRGNAESSHGKIPVLSTAPNASLSKAYSAKTVDLSTTPFDPQTGELTDSQEHETEVTRSRPEAVANSAADIDTPATGNDFADDVGATASSTHHQNSGRNGPAATGSTTDEAETSSAPVTHSHSSDPLRSDKAETLPSSPEVSATNSALVAQRIEQGASTSSVAGSNPAECSTDEDFTPPAFLSRESKPLRPLCQNPDNCSGYGAKTCHTCLKSAGVSYGASA